MASFDLQVGIFKAAVAAALTDSGKAIPVYDNVPDNTLPPYTTIGEATEADWDTDDTFGREATVTIHSWSMYRGSKQVKDMMDSLKRGMHEQKISAFGLNVVMVTLEFSEVMLESDGLTRHGVQRFRILMEEL